MNNIINSAELFLILSALFFFIAQIAFIVAVFDYIKYCKYNSAVEEISYGSTSQGDIRVRKAFFIMLVNSFICLICYFLFR